MKDNAAFLVKRLSEAAVAAMLGAGLTMMIAGSLSVPVDAVRLYMIAALSACVLTGLSYSRASGWITLLLMVTGALTAVALGYRPVERIRSMLMLLREDGGVYSCGDELALLVMLFLMSASYILAAQRTGVYEMAIICVAIVGALWFLSEVSLSIHILPVLAALSAMYARSSGEKALHITPFFALIVGAALLAYWLVPAGGVVYPPLADLGNRTLKTLIRLLSIEDDDLEKRRSFTIASDGWAGYKEIFGGAAYPSDEEVLRVETDEKVYLRGSIRYVYNTRAWVDEDNQSKAGKVKRYMLSGIEGLIYKNEYNRTFGLHTPALARAFESASVHVEVLRDNPYWSIYSPDRTADVALDNDVNAYFNNVGELFAGRQLARGDAYTLDYFRPVDESDAATQAAVARAQEDKDDAYAGVLLMNSGLPSGIDAQLGSLTSEIVSGAETPFDQAVAIRDWLKNNLTYTLKGSYPPTDRDFVSYFVLDAREGYCMYFASAMAVMARIAGLPARYVEGYLADPVEGVCVLTGWDAHAWAEVYFEGYGWVTFDATPPDDGEDDADTSDTNDEDAGTGDDFENTPTPSPAPEPTIMPTPSPSAQPTQMDDAPNVPTPTPEANDEGDALNDEPTMPPSMSEENGMPASDAHVSNDHTVLWLSLIVLALLALAVACVYMRLKRTRPQVLAARAQNEDDKLMCWYRAMLCALGAGGINYFTGDTPMLFAARAQESHACDESFAAFSSAVASAQYSGRAAQASVYALGARAYREIVKRMRPRTRARWLVRRVLRGVGPLNRIP